jgi:hypothetical protein
MYPTPPNVSLYFAERVKAWVICPQPSQSSHVRPQATHGVAIEVPHQPPDRRRVVRLRGYRLTLRDLRDRARLRLPRGWKAWGLVTVAIAILALGILLAPLNDALARVPGFVPPPWWPPTTNPTVEITATEDAYPDITLAGNYLFLAVVLI